MTDTLPQRIEAAEGADREIDEAIQCVLVGAEIEWSHVHQGNIYYKDGRWISIGEIKPYTASIDAALTLVPEGFDWSLFSDGQAVVIRRGAPNSGATGTAATPALALCAAALRAKDRADGE